MNPAASTRPALNVHSQFTSLPTPTYNPADKGPSTADNGPRQGAAGPFEFKPFQIRDNIFIVH